MANPETRIRSTDSSVGHDVGLPDSEVVKSEQDVTVPISVKFEPEIETRRVFIDKEVIELLSDSDNEIVMHVVKEELPEPAKMIKVATTTGTRRKGLGRAPTSGNHGA